MSVFTHFLGFGARLKSRWWNPLRRRCSAFRKRGPPVKHWHVMCSKKRMTKQDDEGIRTYGIVSSREKGLGPGSAGQSGDIQGLSDVAGADSQSVEELVEEGQSFEAEVISGVEDAPDPDVAEVHTKQIPEDDVPSEYLGRD